MGTNPATDPPDDDLLSLLLELQVLDRVPRSGYALRGVDVPESVAEHSFHIAFLVWALAGEEPGVDRARAVELALLHDVVEARTGDLPRSASKHWPAGAKGAMETSVASEMLAPLGARAGELFAEYRAQETAEARLVKACDELQVLIKVTVYERWGTGALDDLRRAVERFDDRGFAYVRRLRDALRSDKRSR